MNETSGSEPEIVRADRKRQRMVLLATALFFALAVRGVHELAAAFESIRALTRTDPNVARELILRLLDGFLFGMAGLMSAAGLYLAVQGWRIRRAQRFPLPGARVVTDTKVLRDGAARRRAWIGSALGAVLLLGAAVLPTWGRGEILERIYLPQDLDLEELMIIDPDTPDVPLYPHRPFEMGGAGAPAAGSPAAGSPNRQPPNRQPPNRQPK